MMAIDGLIPRRIGTINVAGAPWVAQLISTMAIQLFIIVFYVNEASYAAMVQLATIMYLLPYIFSSLYLLLLAIRGKGVTHPHAGTRFDPLGRIFPGAKTGATLASRWWPSCTRCGSFMPPTRFIFSSVPSPSCRELSRTCSPAYRAAAF